MHACHLGVLSFSGGGQERVQECKDLQYVVVTNTMPLQGGLKR